VNLAWRACSNFPRWNSCFKKMHVVIYATSEGEVDEDQESDPFLSEFLGLIIEF